MEDHWEKYQTYYLAALIIFFVVVAVITFMMIYREELRALFNSMMRKLGMKKQHTIDPADDQLPEMGHNPPTNAIVESVEMGHYPPTNAVVESVEMGHHPPTNATVESAEMGHHPPTNAIVESAEMDHYPPTDAVVEFPGKVVEVQPAQEECSGIEQGTPIETIVAR